MQTARATVVASAPAQGSSRAAARPSRAASLVPRAAAEQQSQPQLDRRQALATGLAALAAAAGWDGAAPQPAAAAVGNAPSAAVSEYLPAAEGLPGFRLYSPDAKKTPAIRAGVITADPEFYRFVIPDNWAEQPLLNPLTGNFCMPRCEEPWYEFKFEGKEGTAQLVVTELQKLGSKAGAKVADLGPPEAVVTRVGNFITGTYLDEEDVQAAAKKAGADGRDYYVYEVYTPYSKGATRHLAAFTTKGANAYLFVLSANDKQWGGGGEGALRKMLESFRA